MKTCDYCTHVEMCGWRKELKEQGCEFFSDGIGWISVSERLPIPPTFCLVTTDGSHGDVIDIALYMSDGWHKASEVLAWMPLPPQYEGDDEHVNKYRLSEKSCSLTKRLRKWSIKQIYSWTMRKRNVIGRMLFRDGVTGNHRMEHHRMDAVGSDQCVIGVMTLGTADRVSER